MKIETLLLALCLLLGPATAEVVQTTSTSSNTASIADDKTCNIELLNNYGIIGLSTSQEIPLKMCPDVQNSCCNESDQMEIYYNWIGSGTKDFVGTYIDDVMDVYDDLFDNLADVRRFGDRVIQLTSSKPVSNCSILAQVLGNFQIESIHATVRKNLLNMQNFFVESYQGFYCSLCNQDNHKYFDKQKLTVTMSSKFARDIITSTLPTLIFFYDDMNTYLNTVTRFLQSCDYKGTYTMIDDISDTYRMTPNDDIVNALNECAYNRNKDGWLNSCAIVAQNFSLTRFNEFFEPNKQKMVNYIQFIKNTMSINTAMDGSSNKSTSARILADANASTATTSTAADSTSASSAPVPLSVATGPNIFSANDPTLINLDKFNIVFADLGISLRDEGKNSLINHQLFVETKAMIELRNSDNSSSRSLKLLKKAKSAAKSLWSFFL